MRDSVRIALDFVGCKLNQAETEYLGRELARSGCKLVPSATPADIYILNTCTVTHIADRKSRHLLRMARRRNPAVHIVVAGCYAQRAPDELSRIDGVDLVIGNNDKHRLAQILAERGYITTGISERRDIAHFRTRAFIKIQDGCSNFCAYCIVPLVRGREKSAPAQQVIADIKERVAEGFKEVVLTGTEIGSYHSDGIDLTGLVKQVLAETGVARVRLSSLQPQELFPDFLALWHDERLCRHFHLSLQNGSNSILQRMKRRYSTSDYQQAVIYIRKMMPQAGITTDIIVGFPGETGAEFEDSYLFCQQMEFARIHVFTYSPRDGTEAAQMPEQVKQQVKKLRSARMLALAEQSANNFRRRFLGKTVTVLWEKQDKGIWSGLTDNYIRVYIRSKSELTNQLIPVKLERLWRDGVWGKLQVLS